MTRGAAGWLLLGGALSMSASAGQAVSGEFDYIGAWDYTVEGANPSPECGLMRGTGALHVLGRMEDAPGETYAARLSGKATWETCPNVANNDQYAFVRVDGNDVTISYADPSWKPESLERDGNVMAGSDENGIKSRWEKRFDPELESRAVEVIANLNEHVRTDLADIRRQLAARGIDDVDDTRIAVHFEDHYAACVVDAMKDYAADSGQALATVFNFLDPVTTMVMRRLKPESFSQEAYDVRFRQCAEAMLDQLAEQG